MDVAHLEPTAAAPPVMSRAKRRQLRQPPTAVVTAEARQRQREELRELRKHMRTLKSNGGRTKIRKAAEKRRREEGSEDGSDSEVDVEGAVRATRRRAADADQRPAKKARKDGGASAASTNPFAPATAMPSLPVPLPASTSFATSQAAPTLLGVSVKRSARKTQIDRW